jgi:CBS domain-containing protein
LGLRDNIIEDPVSSVALRGLFAVPAETPVREVVRQMRQLRVGCAVVVDGEGKAVGKFTERLLMKLLVSDPAGLEGPVERLMYRDPDAIGRDQPIARMIELMETRGLRFMTVVDDAGRPVALTGQKGLMGYIAEHFPRQVKVQAVEPRPKLFLDQREGA